MKRTLKENGDSIPFQWPDRADRADRESINLSRSRISVSESQLKPEIKSGVFLWWPEQASPWIHPDDASLADDLIPGNRIFRKEECENDSDRKLGYSKYQYGSVSFRGLPAIWMEIRDEGFELGDLVEIKSSLGKGNPGIASICEILWNRKAATVEYFLSFNGRRSDRPFVVDEFQPAIRLGSHLNARELVLASQLNLA